MIDTNVLRKLAVRPGPSKRYLERVETGELFFLQADTAWELFHRLTRDEALQYLDTRKEQGFNAVLAVALPELDAKPREAVTYGPDGTHITQADDSSESKLFYPNRYGEVPLLNDDPNTPNDKYFDHIDWVVMEAAKRDITIILVPTWATYINRGWQGGPVIFDKTSAASYGAYLGKRYPYLPKVLGGDSNPIWTDPTQIWKRFRADGRKAKDLPLPTVMDLPRYEWFDQFNAMARGIVDAEQPAWEGLGKPLLTYHPTALWLPWSPEALSSTFFGDQEWLTFEGCQSGHADEGNLVFNPPLGFWNARASHVPLTKLRESSNKPVLDLESHYEEMYVCLTPDSGRKWNGDDIRTGAWQSVFSGACGVVYGNNAIWQMYDPDRVKEAPQMIPVCGLDADANWKRSLSLPGPAYVTILSDFFRSLPSKLVQKLQPAQQLLTSTAAPTETREIDGRIDVMSDNATMVLAHSGQGYGFSLDLSCLGDGEVSATWLDPRSGKRLPSERVAAGASVAFTPPSGGSVQDDWVLIVQRA